LDYTSNSINLTKEKDTNVLIYEENESVEKESSSPIQAKFNKNSECQDTQLQTIKLQSEQYHDLYINNDDIKIMNKNNQIKFIQNSGGSDISNYSPKRINVKNDKDLIVEQILKSNTKIIDKIKDTDFSPDK